MDALMLDGNAVAGVLQEVFAAEVTTAIGTCSTCGASEPLGAVHVFRGAGDVLRCPHCDNTLMKIVRDGERLWIGFSGIRTLEVAV
jgi:Family of unknown function (DUF6510)